MGRREKSLLRLDAVSVPGAIIQPDLIAAVANGEAEGQSEESYGLDRGLNLRDEIGRAFIIAKGQWQSYLDGIGGRNPGAVRHRLASGILTRVLGFEVGPKRGYPSRNGANADIDLYQVAGGRVPVAIGAGEDVDHVETLEICGADPIRRSATTLVQGDLNARDGALWGIATNGLNWRLLRDNESITRPGYIEIDLARIFRDDLYSDFTAFWLLAHRSRFPKDEAADSDCALERWRQLGREQGVTARSGLRDGVQKALFHFGRGFLENPANVALVARLNAVDDARLTREDLFRQLLRMVYRLIFVMTAEDREILHPEGAPDIAKAAYKGGYGTGRLRERARDRIAWDRHHDGYEGVKVLYRALQQGEARLGLPALGGLFAPDQTPDLDGARLTNKRFLQGLYGLAWLRRDGALSRINWRDMETEEFGSVYESLLELTPEVTEGGRRFSFVGQPDEDNVVAVSPTAGKNAKGNERKTTGSYYTPDSLVQLLLKESLDPVIYRKVAENPNDPEALLTLKVIDPACGSGHFILAAARKIARRLADLRHAGSPTIAQYRHALRDVARRCIYGVDRNPMAVELCRVAIWIETVEPGKPLTFMDQKIRCGDSLVGVHDIACLANGIPDDAYASLAGDDKGAAAHYRKLNAKQREPKIGKQDGFDFIKPPAELVKEAREIDVMEEDDLEQIARKRAKFEVWQATGWINQKRACDLWTAAFFIPKKYVPPSQGLYEVPLTDNVWTAWAGTLPPTPLQNAVDIAVKNGAFLHWPLVFADVMKSGGFDCVVGNPPWDIIEFDEEEHFDRSHPDIASLGGEKRKLAIVALEANERETFSNYVNAKRDVEASSNYLRGSSRFPLTARGRINISSVFAEMFFALRNEYGRAACIVPTGIATDSTTANFFSKLTQSSKLISLLDFENRNGLFADVHRSYKFCIFTMGSNARNARFAFFLTDPSQASNTDRVFEMSDREIEILNPDTKTAPIFRIRDDAQIANQLYKIFERGRRPLQWLKLHQNVFTSSNKNDLRAFSDGERMNQRIEIYRGTMFHQYDHRYAGCSDGRFRPISAQERNGSIISRSDKGVSRRYYTDRMNDKGLDTRYHIAIRRIARSTDSRTMIAAFLPEVGTDDTASIITTNESLLVQCALVANLNSLVFDYACSHKIAGTDIRKHNFSQLPIIPPELYSAEDLSFVVDNVLKLTITNSELYLLANDIGRVDYCHEFDEDERNEIKAELDAFFARKYGLSREQLAYIIEPSDVKGPHCSAETFPVLRNSEQVKYGEFRTRRLVLAAWDSQTHKRRAA